MKLSQIAQILDDCTECDIFEDSEYVLGEPLFTNLIGEEIHGKYVDGIRIENCPVTGMWVDEDRGYNLVIIIDMTYHREKKRREKERSENGTTVCEQKEI